MKLSVTQENLTQALGVVGRAVSARSSLPVLSHVLLSAESNRLKLATTNLEIGITYWIGCKTEEEGSVTVPSRLFTEFVASLPGGNIELASSDAILEVNSPHYRSTINGIASDEFPLIPQIKSKPVLTIDAINFRDALLQVIVAASLDEARPVLAGVYMYIEEGNLVLVATDSYRLAEKKIPLGVGKTAPKLSVIIPVRTMQELARILADSNADLQVYIDDNQVMFEVGGVELTSRLIEGQFPNYKQIMPDKVETSFEISVAEFSRITKIANLFARENSGSMRLSVNSDGKLDLITSASQVGDNTSSADCSVTGEDAEVSLNAKFLSEALAVLKSSTVRFTISGKLSPCMLLPIGKDATDDYVHIIMPLRT